MQLEQYEAWVLDALGLSPDQLPWGEWTQAYVALSEALTAERETSLAEQASGALGNEHTAAVAALVMGARTFHIAGRLLEAYPPPAGGLLELGAGSGPFGLAAAVRGHAPISLLDEVAPSLELAERIFAAAGFDRPATIRGPAEAPPEGPWAAIAAPFVLNELLAQGRSLETIERWMDRLTEGGRLYLVEPGTRAAGRTLQAARDDLAQRWRILAPCPQQSLPCPMTEPRDWCHLTWSHGPGPLTRRLADRARRRSAELHFSFLVLEKAPPAETSGGERVLEVRWPEKRKVSASLCCSQGAVIRLTAISRDRAAYERLSELTPGQIVALDRSGLESKGDGLRMRSEEALRLKEPL